MELKESLFRYGNRLFLFVEGSSDFVGDVHGVIYVLKVFELFQTVYQAHNLLCISNSNFGRRGGLHDEFGALNFDALLFQALLNRHKIGGSGIYDPLFASVFVIGTASLGNSHHEFVFVDSVFLVGDLLLLGLDNLFYQDLALLFELKSNRTGSTQIAAMMVEGSTNISSGAVAVVGQSVAVDSKPCR